MNFTVIGCLFSGHGFGINTNLFETNVINLAVVIAVVISAGGDALRELLENRKQTILDNLASADARAQEIEMEMNQARQQLERAIEKAKEIRQSGLLAAEKEKKACISQAEGEAQRLHTLKEDNVRFEQQKAMKQVAEMMILASLDVAYKKVEKRMNSDTFHVWVNDHKMSFYETLDRYARQLI
jgi:F-type H+-transporting ATPase subunit b